MKIKIFHSDINAEKFIEELEEKNIYFEILHEANATKIEYYPSLKRDEVLKRKKNVLGMPILSKREIEFGGVF